MPRNYPPNRNPRNATLKQRLERYISPPNDCGCSLWTGGANNRGYGQLRWNGRLCLATRLVWEEENEPIPDGMHVCHRCDTPLCCTIGHLWLGTHSDNMADMDTKGRRPVGSSTNYSKLTDEFVREIFTSNASHAELGRKFGVRTTTIFSVRNKVSWRHITDHIDIRPWTKRSRPEPVDQR